MDKSQLSIHTLVCAWLDVLPGFKPDLPQPCLCTCKVARLSNQYSILLLIYIHCLLVTPYYDLLQITTSPFEDSVEILVTFRK